MSRYVFYPAADRAQDAIWRYSHDQWGEDQADLYLRGMHAHLKELAARKMPWRMLARPVHPTASNEEIYFSRYEKHMIFFRVFEDEVLGVISILHVTMDLPVRLQEDLCKLAEE